MRKIDRDGLSLLTGDFSFDVTGEKHQIFQAELACKVNEKI